MAGRIRVVALALCLGSAFAGPMTAVAQGRRADAVPPAERCAGEARRERIARVGAGGALLLDSGQEVRLADLRFPEPAVPDGRTAPGASGWLASFAGSEVLVQAFGSPDRWGRLLAIVSVPSGAGAVGGLDVAELLVGEGLARVDAGERDALCRPGLLAAEAAARAGRRGLWAAAGEPLPAAEPDGLRERVGRFALVEGRVASVGERAERTYLNFGRDFARDFAVSIPKRSWAAMKRAGLSAEALRGRVVRVRGTLELRRAPSMEIVAADMIEVVETGRPRARPDGTTAPGRPAPEGPSPLDRDTRAVPDPAGERL